MNELCALEIFLVFLREEVVVILVDEMGVLPALKEVILDLGYACDALQNRVHIAHVP